MQLELTKILTTINDNVGNDAPPIGGFSFIHNFAW